MKGIPWTRWLLLTLFVVALAITFVNLGRWQLDRLEQRRDRNAVVVEHENAPVAEFDAIYTREITEADQWQRVRLSGTYDAAHQLVVRYRSIEGATGWEIVAPLDLADGRTVLVDRGFVERPRDQDFPTVAPPPPAGEVTLVGYVRRNEQGRDSAVTPDSGAVMLINSDAIGAWLGRDVVNGYVGVVESEPADPGFTVVEPPPLTEGSHLSYALQWFAFTAIAGVGFVLLIRNDLRDRKKMAARAAASVPASVSKEEG